MNPDLKREIEIELANMDLVMSETMNLFNSIDKEGIPNNIQKTALAAFVSQFYNGVENILKRIHKNYNIPLPKGDDWHIRLLSGFSASSEINLPITLSESLMLSLQDLRRFRHYFFHGYSFNIDWSILNESIVELPIIYNSFKNELKPLV